MAVKKDSPEKPSKPASLAKTPEPLLGKVNAMEDCTRNKRIIGKSENHSLVVNKTGKIGKVDSASGNSFGCQSSESRSEGSLDESDYTHNQNESSSFPTNLKKRDQGMCSWDMFTPSPRVIKLCRNRHVETVSLAEEPHGKPITIEQQEQVKDFANASKRIINENPIDHQLTKSKARDIGKTAASVLGNDSSTPSFESWLTNAESDDGDTPNQDLYKGNEIQEMESLASTSGVMKFPVETHVPLGEAQDGPNVDMLKRWRAEDIAFEMLLSSKQDGIKELELKLAKKKNELRLHSENQVKLASESDSLKAKLEDYKLQLEEENHTLAEEMQRLSEECAKLEAENGSIKEELTTWCGPDFLSKFEN